MSRDDDHRLDMVLLVADEMHSFAQLTGLSLKREFRTEGEVCVCSA